MEARIALAILVLAIPLIGFPIVSPPPDPPDRLVHEVREFEGPDDPDAVDGVVRYSNLSDRGQALFEAALEESPHRVGVGEGAEDFRYEPFGGMLIHYEEQNYQLMTRREYTGPSTQSVIIRLGSLIVGILAGALGGYGWVNAES